MKLREDDLRKTIGAYGFDYASTLLVQSGYRNTSHIAQLTDGRLINLIVYKNEEAIVDRIKRLNRLSKHLSTSFLPVRTPIDDRIIKMSGSGLNHYSCLYNFLPGTTIQWEAYSMKHIKLLGWALADFHNLSSDFDGELPNVALDFQKIFNTVQQYLSDENIISAMSTKLGVNSSISFNKIYQVIDKVGSLNDKQALHLDFVRGNVLFDTARPDDRFQIGSIALSGIIDLEKASYGHPIWDISRSLAFLFVDCPKPKEKIYKYFIDSGYTKRGNRAIGTSYLNELVILYLIYDFYKFLRDNPYDSLSLNHHFLRTRDILIEQNVLYYS